MARNLDRAARKVVQATYWRVVYEFAAAGADAVALHRWLRMRGAAPVRAKIPPWAVDSSLLSRQPLVDALSHVRAVGEPGMPRRPAVSKKSTRSASASAA